MQHDVLFSAAFNKHHSSQDYCGLNVNQLDSTWGQINEKQKERKESEKGIERLCEREKAGPFLSLLDWWTYSHLIKLLQTSVLLGWCIYY